MCILFLYALLFLFTYDILVYKQKFLLPKSDFASLFQECSWMNTNLNNIKSTLSALSHCLLGGVTAIPKNLRGTAKALETGEVPKLWLPLNSCQTSHNIVPWLEGKSCTTRV